MSWFNYSLIRYTPDYKRGETINIGLIVFKESSTDIRIINNPTRLRILGGELTQDYLLDFKLSIERLLSQTKTADEKYAFLSSILNSQISLSSLGKFLIDDIQQYEKKVTRLFDELVKPIHVRIHDEKTPRLTTELKRKFASLNILAKDISDLTRHKVVQNYPINELMGLEADFVLKNGIFHVTEVVDFNVNDIQSKFKETTMKMITFAQSQQLFKNPACYFVYSAAIEKEKHISQHLAVAESYSTKLFNLASKEETVAYFEMMAKFSGASLPTVH